MSLHDAHARSAHPRTGPTQPPNPGEPVSLITRMSLKHRLIVGLLTLVLAVVGIVATTSLNQATMPSVDLPSTSVQATVPGASPEVVEETVTKPLETALEGVGELDTVTTSTSSGMMTAEVTWPF